MKKLQYELVYTPSLILDKKALEIRDVKDAPVLYSAIISNVDILITGDKYFEDINIKKPKIMTASEFLEKY